MSLRDDDHRDSLTTDDSFIYVLTAHSSAIFLLSSVNGLISELTSQ